MKRAQAATKQRLAFAATSAAALVLVGSLVAGATVGSGPLPATMRLQDGTSMNLASVNSSGALSVAVSNYPATQAVSGTVAVSNLPTETTIGGDRVPISAIGQINLVTSPRILAPGEELHEAHALPGGRQAVLWAQASTPISISVSEILANMAGRVVFTATTSRVQASRWDLGSNYISFDVKNTSGSPVTLSAGWIFLIG